MTTLKDVPIDGLFKLSKNGIVYKKISEQGMGNCVACIENVVPKRSRKCHKGIKQIQKFQNIKVYFP